MKTVLIILIVLIAQSSIFSQIDPNDVPSKPLPMKKIFSRALTNIPYGIDGSDVPINVGFFDNYQISTTVGFAETDICVNPRNPLNFVATDNRTTGFIGTPLVFYTLDGGVTWGSVVVPSSQGDPAFAADSLGNFYLAVLFGGVRIYKSTNGGVTWALAGNYSYNSQTDKEWIACDQTTGPFQNYVYTAYFDYMLTNGIMFVRSTNGGATWGSTTNLGSSSTNPGPNLATGPNGRLYVCWAIGAFRSSTDGGATFNPLTTFASYSEPGVVGTSGRHLLYGDIRVNGHPQMAVDMSAGPYRGNIYIAYASNPFGPDNADVFMVRSTDGGVSFSTQLKVNDDATFNPQCMTDISVDNAGRVWQYWYDSRADSNLIEVYAAVSTNGGASFSPNFRVSSQFNPAVIKLNQGDHSYFGDYQGMSGKQFTFPCYVGVNNNRNDYTAYLPDYGISFSKTVDSINAGGTSVVRVRAPMMGPYSGTVTYSAVISPSPAPGTITPAFSPSNVKVFTGTPDSLTLNCATTANVPLNTYTVTVTGAENGGPRTHTRTYQILVGNFQAVHHNQNEVPNVFALEQNYPNPFNPETNIEYSLPRTSLVTLKIYDMLGNEVMRVVNGLKQTGYYSEKVNASSLASGIYFYKLEAKDISGNQSFVSTKKLILIK